VEHGLDRAPLVVSPEVYQTPIEKLELSPRTLNCLKRAQINRVGEVLEMSDDDLLKIRNFGEKSLVELQEKLVEHGITGPRQERDGDSSDVGPFTADDLTELMGGGEDGDSTSLPSGMTFDDASPLSTDVESDGDGLEYEEID
jgi:hypothetical protein